jgi:hypothetical protein
MYSSPPPERDEPDIRDEAGNVGPDASVARALVYLTVCVGVVIAVGVLLFAHGSELDLFVPVLALAAAAPYLVYARLAMAQPGAEAIVAGVLLLAVGAWSYLAALDAGRSTFLVLPVMLTLMECAVFAGGAMLRRVGTGEHASQPRGRRSHRTRSGS